MIIISLNLILAVESILSSVPGSVSLILDWLALGCKALSTESVVSLSLRLSSTVLLLPMRLSKLVGKLLVGCIRLLCWVGLSCPQSLLILSIELVVIAS